MLAAAPGLAQPVVSAEQNKYSDIPPGAGLPADNVSR